jgi:glycosyltransferase involved in cell wall biosynthesis
MPKVSICLTTYNRADVLAETINSILAQTFSDFELIINDDNSSDNTRELCEAYCKKDERVKYFRNESNLKMPGNLNSAIQKAQGVYIANLHDGDIYVNNIIQKWHDALEAYPDALFVFNGYEIIGTDGKKSNFIHPGLQEVNEGRILMDYFLTTFTSGPWGTVMARAEAYQTYGLFNADYGFISDVEMWLRLGLHGKVAYVKEPLITLTPRELFHNYYFPHWNVVRNNFRILKRYYEEYGMAEDKTEEINKRIVRSVLKNYLILLKHLQWARLAEAARLFRRSPFLMLQILGKLTPSKNTTSQTVKEDTFWEEIIFDCKK